MDRFGIAVALMVFAGGVLPGAANGQVVSGVVVSPSIDRWVYPFNSSPGTEANASVFAALQSPGFDDRDSQFLLAFGTAGIVPTEVGELRYRVHSLRVRVVVSNDQRFEYDPTPDAVASSYAVTDLDYVADADVGKPVELFAAGFRNGESAATFGEYTAFSTTPTLPPQQSIRSVFAATVAVDGTATDVSNQVKEKVEAPALAVGRNPGLTPGQLVPQGTELFFDVDVSSLATQHYLSRGLNSGELMLMVTSLHPASGGPGGGGGVVYPAFYTKENAVAPVLGYTASLEIVAEVYPYVDFNLDGDFGTDQDIEAFFRALAGNGGNSDFNIDGDYGTDQDIECFFRALAGGSC